MMRPIAGVATTVGRLVAPCALAGPSRLAYPPLAPSIPPSPLRVTPPRHLSTGPQRHDEEQRKPSIPSSTPPNALTSHITTLTNRLRTSLTTHRSRLEPRIRSSFSNLSDRWNTYSGYASIDLAKQRVHEAEQCLASLRSDQQQVRERYVSAVSQRASSQRTINDLLSRKSSWSDEDLVSYTKLLRSEHAESRAEEEARAEFEEAERRVGKGWDEVVKRTLERYHDEQVWSDRVREVSSYTQLAAVGLNILIFLIAIFLVEPFKRRKLAETFETRLLQGEEQGRLALEGVIAQFEQRVGEVSEKLVKLDGGQETLLAAAGAGTRKGTREERMDTKGSATVVAAADDGRVTVEGAIEGEDVLSRARRQTRWLHTPRSDEEKEQRRIAAVAAGVGTIFGGLLVAFCSR